MIGLAVIMEMGLSLVPASRSFHRHPNLDAT